MMRRAMASAQARRPYVILAAVTAALIVVAAGTRTAVDAHLAFSVLQYFATLAPVALGLGSTMIAGEYDLSVGSVLGLAGCVAVIAGATSPAVGLACGLALGAFAGLLQGLLIVWLRLSSVSVTLGGLMIMGALSYVVTGNQTVTYPDLAVAMAVNEPIGGIVSARGVLALACYALVALLLRQTRLGRDLAATGSDRAAATTAGVGTATVLVLVFATSGALAALSGVLLSFSLASASPAGLTDVLVPATAATIIGGVSLSGGRGHALGIAAGVLTLCVLDAGLNALGASPFMQNVVMEAVLVVVGIGDAPLLTRYLRRSA